MTESFEELNDFGLTLEQLEEIQEIQNKIIKDFQQQYPPQIVQQKEKEYTQKYKEKIQQLITHYEKLYLTERKNDTPFSERKYILDKIKIGKTLLHKTFSLPNNLQTKQIILEHGFDYYFNYYPIYESTTEITKPTRMAR